MCASDQEDPIYDAQNTYKKKNDAQKILWYLTITVTRFKIKK